ncbi:sugar ABC transporter permease [Spirochaetia bacterium]|nr:sugar ABC transporter permease [Spirochaetia bacterium]
MKPVPAQAALSDKKDQPYFKRLIVCIGANKSLYVMILPVLAFYIIFSYVPMYGVIIAFKNFQPGLGMWDSPWVGLQNFIDFFTGPYFSRVLTNTLVISFASIIFGFPAPIILALLLNEVRSPGFKKIVQTITYIPHFISLVVVCGMILQFTNSRGVITLLVNMITGAPMKNMMGDPANFVPIYVISGIWQEIGWGSIVYLSAITSIDTQIYEAAEIDGANFFSQMWHVTIPGILPVIMVMLILRLGNVMSVGFEKIILLYNPAIYSTADVISSFTYRQGLQDFNWSFSTAVGLFNSVINYVFLFSSNWLSRKLNDNSLW